MESSLVNDGTKESEWQRCSLYGKIVINSHWEPSLPNAPGKDKIWEEASPTAATPESQGKLPQ